MDIINAQAAPYYHQDANYKKIIDNAVKIMMSYENYEAPTAKFAAILSKKYGYDYNRVLKDLSTVSLYYGI